MDAHDGGEAPRQDSNLRWIVIAIVACVLLALGFAAVVFGPNLWQMAKTRKADAAETHLGNLAEAIENYRLVHKELPPDLGELTRPSERSPVPFLTMVPMDPWGGFYEYRVVSRRGYDLRSAGPDGDLETADDIVWSAPGR